MDLQISAVLENYLLSRLGADLNGLLLITWGSWLFWTLYKIECVQSFSRQCVHIFDLSQWIVIPLILTILLFLPLENAFTESHIREVTRYTVPVITFFLGDLAARRRSEQEKVKTYRKVLYAMKQEACINSLRLDAGNDFLSNEINKLRNEEYTLLHTLNGPSPCDSRFIEVFLNNAQASWGPGSLYTEVEKTSKLLSIVNQGISTRKEMIDRLNDSQKQNRSNEIRRLWKHDSRLCVDIRVLNTYVQDLQEILKATLAKKSTQFADLMEF